MRTAYDLAARTLWAIDEGWLRTILEIAAREGEGPEAVAAKLGRPLQNARKVETRDGVAIVPITGPIFRRANFLTEVSGATSVEILARDFRAALDDPQIHAVILDVDSPGGQVDGIHEMADMIREARRPERPIIAYVGSLAASGAYWLASAASEIRLDAMARVGSIGVVLTVARPDPKESARTIEIVSSQSPRKRMDLESDADRAELQARVDELAGVMIGSIAQNRGTTPEAILEDFGGGGLRIGSSAVDKRMADSLSSLERTIGDLAKSSLTIVMR